MPFAESRLDFIELPQFTRRWRQLGLDDEGDLSALQLTIMEDPNAGAVIPSGGGLRKLRFAPKRWKTGKSGAVRVLYVHFEQLGVVLLCLAYGKNEVGNISSAVKKFLAKAITEIEGELIRRAKRRRGT